MDATLHPPCDSKQPTIHLQPAPSTPRAERLRPRSQLLLQIQRAASWRRAAARLRGWHERALRAVASFDDQRGTEPRHAGVDVEAVTAGSIS